MTVSNIFPFTLSFFFWGGGGGTWKSHLFADFEGQKHHFKHSMIHIDEWFKWNTILFSLYNITISLFFKRNCVNCVKYFSNYILPLGGGVLNCAVVAPSSVPTKACIHATTADFTPSPPPSQTLTVNTFAFATNFIFMLYNGNSIVFCFNHSSMCIIGSWKGCFCRSEYVKRGDFQAGVYRAWIHVLVGTDERATSAHINSPPPPSTYDVNGKIFDTVKTVAFAT